MGIIPAHAGNTWRVRYDCHLRRDHPRACGEHQRFSDFPNSLQGSSPRMRGTLRLHEDGSASLGIIPAHAGNTH